MIVVIVMGGCAMESRGLEQVNETAGLDAAVAPSMIVAPSPPAESALPAPAPTSPAPVADTPPSADAAPAPPAMWDAGLPDLLAPDAVPTLDTGLLLYLRFDDAPGASMARDDSGLNQRAMLHQIAGPRAWVPGRIGGALALNGGESGGWISVDDASSLNRAGAELTLATWIYPGETSAGPVAARTASPAGLLYVVEVATDGHLHVSVNGAGGAVLEGPLLPKLKWTHLAVTAGRGQVRIFINGVAQLAQQYRADIPGDSTPLLIGTSDAKATKNNRFTGRLDELVLYERVLADGEVGALARGATPAGY
jgi:hypothetical protein